MMSDAFARALPFVLQWEGGYVDHPADPGGATNKGVTQKVYDTWRRDQGQPARSVRAIDDIEVAAIYHQGYWVRPRCDDVGAQIDLVHFDTAVNMGPKRAVQFLQRAAGCTVDGDFGPGTLTALRLCTPADTLVKYCNEREAFYRQIVANKPSQGVFLKGWLNRLNALRRAVGLEPPSTERGVDNEDDSRGLVEPTARIPDIGEGEDS